MSITLLSTLFRRCKNRPPRSLKRKPFHRHLPLRLERLEDRVTPTVNPAAPFELDGNATTQSATTHDWDQVFADAGSPAVPNKGSFTQGPTSQALAGTFVNDPINTTQDDIFTGGGSKDPNAISQWQFKN